MVRKIYFNVAVVKAKFANWQNTVLRFTETGAVVLTPVTKSTNPNSIT